MRNVIEAVRTLPSLLWGARPTIARLGGFGPAIKKAFRIYRLEGLRGIVLRLRFHSEADMPAKWIKPSIEMTHLQSLFANASTKASENPDYVARATTSFAVAENPLKLIAFYLPQFHPIPENDQWWGQGFTEWTNVAKAMPQYLGHHQPRLPADLGFYDLRIPDIQRQQIELAKQYGIFGFCYHHYWFGGKRLLERPFNQILADPKLDLPFCVCWANENWTRRWDGKDSEVLIAQSHSPEDDIAFIEDLAPALRDPRYIRFNGRPVLIVYRAADLSDAKATTQRWRDYCWQTGIGELYLVAARTFGVSDPRPYGFDAAIDFPPHIAGLQVANTNVRVINPQYSGLVFDYKDLAAAFSRDEDPGYPLIKTVSPSWDNEARRPGRGTVFHGASPKAYADWLNSACSSTLQSVQSGIDLPPFVFINAWNEWAEGAYLEPDRRYGFAYLEATARTLERFGAPLCAGRIVVVSHDAHPHGAQMLALNLCRTLKSKFGFDVTAVLLNGGRLRDEFAKVATVHELAGADPNGEEAERLASLLRESNVDLAICNTTVSGHFAGTLKRHGIATICLVHELPKLIAAYKLEDHAASIAASADYVVCAADVVADAFSKAAQAPQLAPIVRPQGLYKRNALRARISDPSLQAECRRKLGLPLDRAIALGVGYADLRKGFDLFIDMAERAADTDNVVFVWVGHQDSQLLPSLQDRIDRLVGSRKLVLPGLQSDTDGYYAAADVYCLTSREDPYPSTVLEALDVGLPVVAFDGASGTCSIIIEHSGHVVPGFDLDAYCAAIRQALGQSAEARGTRARRFWQRRDISFQGYVHDLLALTNNAPKSVSVVIPNYNYARYLPERIDSVLRQTHPISELIILDDASTDASQSVIERKLAEIDIPVTYVGNDQNSGSVFKQWLKGAEIAKGEFIWIAEADDLADPGFLAEALQGFDADDVVLSYTESKQIDETGCVLSDNYHRYVEDISTTRWLSDYVRSGAEEIETALSIKNTIPNVSAVVFKRENFLTSITDNLEQISGYRVAGDWCTYVHLLQTGSCAFRSKPLNFHRRHSCSVTISKFSEQELNEIVRMQAFVEDNFDVGTVSKTKAAAYTKILKARLAS